MPAKRGFFLLGGTPCCRDSSSPPLRDERQAGRAIKDFVSKVFDKEDGGSDPDDTETEEKIQIFDIATAARCSNEISLRHLQSLVDSIVESGIEQIIIAVAADALVRVAEFIQEKKANIGRQIFLFSLPKFFSNNKKLGPLAIGFGLGFFDSSPPDSVRAFYRRKPFNPYESVWNHALHRFVQDPAKVSVEVPNQ